MQNEAIDFQSLRKTKHFNPLFQNCSKAISSKSNNESPSISDERKVYSYLVINSDIKLPQKMFQCKSLCPVFISNSESYILVKGQNLWDYYRANKARDIILTEQQIWVLIKNIIQALQKIQQFGYQHSHLKEYAIYRQSPYSYQLVFHPFMQSMLTLAQNNKFYWYQFYLSPEELKINSNTNYTHTEYNTVFSLGLLILNVLNSQDFNRDVYSRKKYQVDWQIIHWKLKNSQQKYSHRLVSLVQNCLKQFPEQRYNFRMIQEQCNQYAIFNKNIHSHFQMKINSMINSRLANSQQIKRSKLTQPITHLEYQQKDKSLSKSKHSSNQKQSSQEQSHSKQKKAKIKSHSKQKYPQQQKQTKQKFVLNNIKQFNYQSPQVKKWKNNQNLNLFGRNQSPTIIQQVDKKNIRKTQILKTNVQDLKNQQKDEFSNIYNPKLNQSHSQNKEKVHIKFKNPQIQIGQNQIRLIGFDRGTFGGQIIQSPRFQNFANYFKNRKNSQVEYSPTKQKQKQIQKQKQSHIQNFKPMQSISTDSVFIANKSKQQEEFQKTKLATFGSMQQQVTSNIKNQLEKQIQKQKQIYKQIQKQHLIRVNISQQQSNLEYSQSSVINKDLPIKNITIEDLKELQLQFASIYSQIQKIKTEIDQIKKSINLQIEDCLKPIEILQKKVTLQPGVYIEGNIYYGLFKNGRRNGFGLEIFPSNQYYFGNFKDDLFHGQGFYFWNKNQYFLGLFLNGKKQFGYLYGSKLNYCGQFKNSKKMNGIGTAIYKSGQIYTGIWKQGKIKGFGQLIEITRDKFVGYWEKGKRSGYGEHSSLQFPNEGQKLKAIWKNHEIISDVIIQYSNGNFYEGSISQFQKHGKGLYKFKKGGYFKGTFYRDEATHGQLVYKNGQVYIGSLKNMRRHGFGEYRYSNGTIKKGNWVDDVRVQKLTQPKMN